MKRLAAAFLLTALCGCAALSPSGSVEVRIENESAVAFERVLVVFPDQQEEYGPLPPNGTSGYRAIERAYRYAYVEVTVEGEKHVAQPIDYVGESFLAPGRYTYVLRLAEGPWGLSLELREEG